jgi:hypothetical protein
MCEWGTTTEMEVTIPAHLSYTGQARRKMVGIDSCVASIVAALNAGGVPTVASCCGHGKRPGNVALGDGRELIVAPNFSTAREVEQAFPRTSAAKGGSASVTIWLDVWQDRLTGGLQVSIGDESGGFRIMGPKFLGASERLRHHKLTPEDARSIRRYLDLIEVQTTESAPCPKCGGPGDDGYASVVGRGTCPTCDGAGSIASRSSEEGE